MDGNEAQALLDGVGLVPMLQGAMASVKEVQDKCLRAGIPVLLGRPEQGKG